jgi:small subunit ribosomal protein S20
MPNIKSAAKRHRQSLKRRNRNRFHKGTMRTHIKKLHASIEAGDKDSAQEALKTVVSIIDKTGKRGIIHKDKADRLKSRLTTRFNRAFSL